MSQQDKKFAKYAKDNIRKKWKRRKKHLQSQFDENQALEETQVFFWFGTAAIGRWMEGRQITNLFDVQDYNVGNKEGRIYLNSAILEIGDEREWIIVEKEMFRENELCQATQGSHEGAIYYCAHRLVMIGNLVTSITVVAALLRRQHLLLTSKSGGHYSLLISSFVAAIGWQ